MKNLTKTQIKNAAEFIAFAEQKNINMEDESLQHTGSEIAKVTYHYPRNASALDRVSIKLSRSKSKSVTGETAQLVQSIIHHDKADYKTNQLAGLFIWLQKEGALKSSLLVQEDYIAHASQFMMLDEVD